MMVMQNLYVVKDFNPRTPCGVRRKAHPVGCAVLQFQSTHPVWGATGEGLFPIAKWLNISIHAPRVGCDLEKDISSMKDCMISIHAPRVGCDIRPDQIEVCSDIFQSTHPVWGATRAWPPREIISLGISIHAPRVGCDSRWR